MGADSGLAAVHRMKKWSKILLLVVAFLGFSHAALAGPASPLTLQWQGSTDPDVAGYALYYGVDGSPITNRMDVGLGTTAIVTDLTVSSTYSFYVVAYDVSQNESDPSNLLLYTTTAISAVQLSQISDGTMAISFSVAPGAPCHVEYTDTLTPPNWMVLTIAVGDSNGFVTINDSVSATGSRFYRAVVP